MNSSHTTRAIVLEAAPMGEDDLLVTLFTEDRGKVKAVARGARRGGGQMACVLDLFSLVEVTLAPPPSGDLLRIIECERIDGYRGLARHLDALVLASCLVELLRGSGEGMGDEPEHIFHLAREVLERLASEQAQEVLLHACVLKILALMGLRPELTRCVACGVDPAAGPMAFSPALGGVLAGACRAKAPDPIPLSQGARRCLEALLSFDLDRCGRLRVSARQLREVRRVTHAYAAYAQERDLKSFRFVGSGSLGA